MAFVGAISDLFSCGRPRRPQTRDGASTGEDATGMAATSGIGGTLERVSDTTPRDTSAPHDATLHPATEEGSPHIGAPEESKRVVDSGPLTNRSSTEVGGVRTSEDARKEVPEEVPQGHTGRNEPSDGKAATSKGWQVEQRFLVTTSTPGASSATPELNGDNVKAAVLETTTPPPSTHQNASTHQDASTHQVVSAHQDASTHQDATAHQDATTRSSPIETNEPELETREEAAVFDAVPATKFAEDDAPVSVAVPMPQIQEATLVSASPKLESPGVLLPPAASTQFLDLPTEIRNLIYEHTTEASPIRMCRHDDPVLKRPNDVSSPPQKRQFYNLTQVCQQVRKEFLPVYEQRTEYIIDLWTQRANLTDIDALKGQVAMDIDAACFDMHPIDLLPLIRYLASTHRTNCRFASTEGVVFRSIESIVEQLNKLLPSPASNKNWLAAVKGPMKRIDLHLFPHEDIRQYYRFRGAEPMLRIVYPSSATEGWMKQSHKSGGEYKTYLEKTRLDNLDMHVVVGHASQRTTNEGRLPLDWRLSYVGSRLSIDQAARISGTWTR